MTYPIEKKNGHQIHDSNQIVPSAGEKIIIFKLG